MGKRVEAAMRRPQQSVDARNPVAERENTTAENVTLAAPLRRDSPRQQFPVHASEDDKERWQSILDKYNEELARGGIKRPTIDKDLSDIESPAQLLVQISGFDFPDRGVFEACARRLKSSLSVLDDFCSLVEAVLRVNSEISTIVWGSIKLIFKFAYPDIQETTGVLEELCQTLPRQRAHEQGLSWTKNLEYSLSDFCTEVLVFLAKTIVYFRNNPILGACQKIRPEFRDEVVNTIARLRRSSQRIDKEADAIPSTQESYPAETMTVVKKEPKSIAPSDDIKLPCYMIPYGFNPQFLYREEEISKLRNAIEPGNCNDGSRTVAIYGLGGVGKTQLALHYANSSTRLYDIILWIPAGTRVTMVQALANFSESLGLSLVGDPEDDSQLAQAVKVWLNTTSHRFLLVFDNVDNVDFLLPIWPASDNGSIIITTRCPSVAFKWAANAIHIEPFAQEGTLQALTSLTGMIPAGQEESSAAESICHFLGGLPLAIAQVAEFIADRGCSYEEFLSLYRRSPSKVHIRGSLAGYDHNLSTVWDLSLAKLPESAHVLQSLLCFFDPDKVPERLLTIPEIQHNRDELEFLNDEFAFGDAVGALIRSSLISRSPTTKTISTHRLVQTTVFGRLEGEEVRAYLDTAIKLLSKGFPNTFGASGHHQGHGWKSWNSCTEVLPHVYWLIDLTKKHKLAPSDTNLYAELIFRSGTYLWEKEKPTAAKNLLTYGFSLDIDPVGRVSNLARRVLGHIALDMAKPQEALDAYSQTLEERLRLPGVEADSPFVAEVYESIACSYTEMGNISKAYEYLEKSTNIHETNGREHMGRTDAIYALAYLRAEEPDRAFGALSSCWRLQGLTEKEVAGSEYPKHSGDIVLLARIQYMQGNREYGLHLAKKSIDMRRKILGDKSPRVVDSMYLVSNMLKGDGKPGPAMKLLREIVEMSQGEAEMQGHFARALSFLAELEEEMGNDDEALALREKAREAKRNILGVTDQEAEKEGNSSQELVGYMLW